MTKNIFQIKFLVLFILIVIAFVRSPYIFLKGRFMYGDAFFYVNSLSNNWYESLFLIHKEAGYINLFSNISSVINAKTINIEYAPLFNVYFCFLLIIILISLVLFSNIILFKSNFQKYLICVLLLIAPPFVFEIWLDALNAQTYLAIITFIILFIEYEKKIQLYLNPVILVIAGLSGIYSCLLTPLFIIKYYFNRRIINLINSSILLLTSLVQLTIIFISKSSNTLYHGKLDFSISSNEFISFSYNVLVRTFFSGTFPNYIVSNFKDLKNDKDIILILSILVFLLFIILFIFFIKKIIKSNKEQKIIFLTLIYFFLSSTFLVIVGGVNDSINGRYAVIPGTCLLLITFIFSFDKKKNFLNYISIFLLISILITGTLDFRNQKHITYFDCIDCPHWKDEIQKLKINKEYKVEVWPYTENKKIQINIK